MSAATHSQNVIALAPYRAAREARRPPRPYLLWYPDVGLVKPDAVLKYRESTQRGACGPETA